MREFVPDAWEQQDYRDAVEGIQRDYDEYEGRTGAADGGVF